MSESLEVIATGKRKTAIARVRMKPGTGQVVVNGRPMTEYFPREVLHMRIQNPFEVVGAESRWDVSARITGGGVAGQAEQEHGRGEQSGQGACAHWVFLLRQRSGDEAPVSATRHPF